MKMKKLLALLLSALMIFALAACGSKEEPAPEPEDAVEETAEQGEEDATEESSQAAANALDTSVPVTDKEDRAGYDIATTNLLEDEGFMLMIPDYFGDDLIGEGDVHQYRAESGESLVILNVVFYPSSEEDFESKRQTLCSEFLKDSGIEDYVTQETKDGGVYFEGNMIGFQFLGEVDAYYNEDAHRCCYIMLMMSDNAKYDYFPDFYKIRGSIVKK